MQARDFAGVTIYMTKIIVMINKILSEAKLTSTIQFIEKIFYVK